jgi:hypothetical protein
MKSQIKKLIHHQKILDEKKMKNYRLIIIITNLLIIIHLQQLPHLIINDDHHPMILIIKIEYQVDQEYIIHFFQTSKILFVIYCRKMNLHLQSDRHYLQLIIIVILVQNMKLVIILLIIIIIIVVVRQEPLLHHELVIQLRMEIEHKEKNLHHLRLILYIFFLYPIFIILER